VGHHLLQIILQQAACGRRPPPTNHAQTVTVRESIARGDPLKQHLPWSRHPEDETRLVGDVPGVSARPGAQNGLAAECAAQLTAACRESVQSRPHEELSRKNAGDRASASPSESDLWCRKPGDATQPAVLHMSRHQFSHEAHEHPNSVELSHPVPPPPWKSRPILLRDG
jgi:hypothetical protein